MQDSTNEIAYLGPFIWTVHWGRYRDLMASLAATHRSTVVYRSAKGQRFCCASDQKSGASNGMLLHGEGVSPRGKGCIVMCKGA